MSDGAPAPPDTSASPPQPPPIISATVTAEVAQAALHALSSNRVRIGTEGFGSLVRAVDRLRALLAAAQRGAADLKLELERADWLLLSRAVEVVNADGWVGTHAYGGAKLNEALRGVAREAGGAEPPQP